MDTITLKPERRAQLEEYAERHGKDAATALDDVLADALAWEREEYIETVESVNQAYASVKAGHTRPASEFLDELRAKHGFPH